MVLQHGISRVQQLHRNKPFPENEFLLDADWLSCLFSNLLDEFPRTAVAIP